MLDNVNSIILSTINTEGFPNSSYAPTALDENGNFLIYISQLSKHTLNLLNNPKVSIMIIDDESDTENIFGRKRFTMDATSIKVNRDSKEWEEKIDILENKFGETVTYLKNMTDFYLFKLKPSEGLLVHGFARAFVFYGEDLDQIKYLNDKGHTRKKK